MIYYYLVAYRSPYFISLTTDNASVNDVLIEATARLLLERYGIPPSPNQQIRCIAHAINLIVQAMLFAMDEADDPDKIDNYLADKSAPVHYDVDNDQDQRELDEEEFDDPMDTELEDQNIDLLEEESALATQSPLKRVSAFDSIAYSVLNFFNSFDSLLRKLSHLLNDVEFFTRYHI